MPGAARRGIARSASSRRSARTSVARPGRRTGTSTASAPSQWRPDRIRHPSNDGVPFQRVSHRTRPRRARGHDAGRAGTLAATPGRGGGTAFRCSGLHRHVRDPDNIQLELFCEPGHLELRVHGQRRARRRRTSGHAPAARVLRGDLQADRDEGGLWRGRVRSVQRPARRAGRRRLSRAGEPGAWRIGPDRRGPGIGGALGVLQQAFLETGAPSTASARRGCSWPARRSSHRGAEPSENIARPSPATCAAAPATEDHRGDCGGRRGVDA